MSFRNIVLILCGLIGFASSTVTKFSYASCGSSGDIASNVVLNVEPALPQTDYILYLDYDLSKVIAGGTSKYSITMNGIPFTPSTGDLCDEINKSNITCPLSAGFVASQSIGTIPTGISGKLTITNEWFNTDNSRILCMKYQISIT
jgi:hypothetical protein